MGAYIKLALILSSLLALPTFAGELSSCEEKDGYARELASLKANITTLEDQRARVTIEKTGLTGEKHRDQLLNISNRELDLDKQIRDVKEQVNILNTRYSTASTKCITAESEAKRMADCAKKKDYEWVGGSCKKIEIMTDRKKVNLDTSECRHANEFDGTLRGEECRKAMKTIQESQARGKAINETTTILATATAQMSAAKSNGSATSAFESSGTAMKGMATAKFAQGISDMKAYTDLSNAHSDAESAANYMRGVRMEVQEVCSKFNRVDENGRCVSEQLTKFNLPNANINTLDKLDGAIQQTQAQAQAAKSASGASGIQTIANMLVGAQAMQAANRMNQNAQAMGTPGVQRFMLSPMGSGASGGGFQTSPTTPSDSGEVFDETNGAFAFPSGGRGGIRGGLAKGMPGMGGAAPYGAAKATVSGASGGGGGGGGRGGSPSKAPPRRSRKGPSAIGSYESGSGNRVSGSLPSGGGGDSALTDALSKLLGGDPNNMQSGFRGLASEEGAQIPEELSEDGSAVYAQDVSLFQIISTKYRQLNGRGAI